MLIFYDYYKKPDELPNYKERYDLMKGLTEIFPQDFIDYTPIINYIKKSTLSINYARFVKGERWLEAEPYIIEPYQIIYYAAFVIHGRWFEKESLMFRNSYATFRYAREVIGERWLEAEPFIMKDAESAFYYAYYVIKDKWLEAEQYISQNDYWWDEYNIHILDKGQQ